MNNMRKIFVFGIGSGIKTINFEESEMLFLDKNSPDHLASGDIVIYFSGSFEYEYIHDIIWGDRLKDIPAEAIRREKEVRSALEKGKIVCFVGSHANDYVSSGILKSYSIGHGCFHDEQIRRNLNVKRSEFKSFLDDVGATYLWFYEPAVDEVVCYADETNVAGFSKEIGKGIFLFIPCVLGSTEITYVIDHLKRLSKALIAYSVKRVLEPPSFIESFQLANEKNAREKINEITLKEIKPLQEKVTRYVELKKILWLGDKNLVNATCEFLRNIGFQTLVDEVFEEDLWIVNEKEKLVIIEVKGLNNNLTRQDISKLDEHREARQMPDLTGLLISNTFMTADSLEGKDVPFPPNVIEKAVNTNLLITRTLDLCRIYDYLEQNGLPPKTLLDAIIGKKGWLTFKNGKIVTIT